MLDFLAALVFQWMIIDFAHSQIQSMIESGICSFFPLLHILLVGDQLEGTGRSQIHSTNMLTC